MTSLKNTKQFIRKNEALQDLTASLEDYAINVLRSTFFTETQLEEMKHSFAAWINAGTCWDCFPQLDFFGPELKFLLKQCIGDSAMLKELFYMVEYEGDSDSI